MRGGQGCWECTIRAAFRRPHRFFERKVAEEPDELVQETFLACVKRRNEFRRQSSFRTFLFAVARFELYAHWRRRARNGQAIDFGEVSLADLATTPGTRKAPFRKGLIARASICSAVLSDHPRQLHFVV